MNVKTTLILLILVLIVGGLFFLVERKAPTTREIERQAAQSAGVEGEPLFDDEVFAPDEVERFEIARDGQTYLFAKEGDDWSMTEPARFPADLPTLPTEAATLRYTTRFEAGDEDLPALDKLRLDPPEATVTFRFADGGAQTIHLGRRGAGGRGYAKINDDPTVYYIGDALHRAILDRGATDLLANRLSVPAIGQVDRVVLDQRGRTIEVVKHEGVWALAGEDSGRADQEEIDQLLGAARSLWISRFDVVAPEDLSLYGLDSPRAELSIHVPGIEDPAQPDLGDERHSRPPRRSVRPRRTVKGRTSASYSSAAMRIGSVWSVSTSTGAP